MKIRQELLFAKALKIDRKGQEIFNTMQKCCNRKEIALKKRMSAAIKDSTLMTRRAEQCVLYRHRFVYMYIITLFSQFCVDYDESFKKCTGY